MAYLFQGLTVGLAYVAPIGLQNLFVINSALSHDKKRAFVTALIVIFFDMTLSLACFFGIGAIMERYIWVEKLILGAGSLIVIYIGIKLLKTRVDSIDRSKTTSSIGQTIASAGIVTWFNPQALIDGTLLLGAFKVTLQTSESTSFITGVVLASCIWFMSLTIAISLLKDKFTAKVLRLINIICGTVIACYGVKLLYSFIIQILT